MFWTKAAVAVGLTMSTACANSGSTAGLAEHSSTPPTEASTVSPAVDTLGAVLAASNRAAAPEQHDIAYTDVTGAERTVLVEVRRPEKSRTTTPVVVWSHGGSTGKNSPKRVGEQWGKALNRADFTFVAIAHPGRTDESRQALCVALGIESCGEFKYLLWDRLRDAQTVFDWLEASAAAGELFIDMDRLVYGGHSAGAMAVMVMAGMESPYANELSMPTDDRPAAFLAASPPGAEVHGYTPASFEGFDRPMLLLTGDGDTTNGNTGPDRLALFDLITFDQVMLVSTDFEHVGHTTFNLNTRPCLRSGGSVGDCRDTVRALGKTAQAFLRSALSANGLDPHQLVAASRAHLPDHVELRSTSD